MHCGPHSQNFGWALVHPAYAVAPPWVLGDAVSFSSGVRAEPHRSRILAFAVLNAFKTHLDAPTQHFWFFGHHCNKWQNESQSRLRSNLVGPICGRAYLLATYAI